ncbi:MAG: hypothetical protein ACTSVY_08055 [Candidatus Helarchaeota archaeon]
MSNLKIFETIEAKLEEMVKEKSINLDIIYDFNLVQDKLKSIQSYWESNKEKNIEKSFILYHCARNLAKIIEKIINNFKIAKQMHQNPQVVYDTINVLPVLVSSYEELMNVNDDFFEKDDIFKHFSENNRQLRDIAETFNCLPSTEEEIKEKNKEEIIEDLQKVIDSTFEDIHIDLEEFNNK